ncbi:MAG: L,D-transpeptidase, partial [Nanoarchaeota archaeon]
KDAPFYYNEDFSLLDLIRDYRAVAGKSAPLQKRIVIDKSERKAQVYIDDCLLKEYPIALGLNPEGDKVKAWDYKTPEGEFYVAGKKTDSQFGNGVALYISYPDIEDAERGLESRLINKKQYNRIKRAIDQCTLPPQNTRLGYEVLLHGGGVGRDWTYGCIAFRNNDIDEIYLFAEVGCDPESMNPLTKIVINS